MEKMTIIEYLTFTNKINEKLKEQLKTIYFQALNGKEAKVYETKKDTIICEILIEEYNTKTNLSTFANIGTLNIIEMDKKGNILNHRNKSFTNPINTRKS